jgi:methylmalonyl-CoA mutase, N-terminal domain
MMVSRPERSSPVTDSGIPIEPVYTAEDIADLDAARDLGLPGAPPFTRGPYETMYRGQLWTMRQYAGFGTAAHANERFRFLLDRGQTALSVAFDLPTQLGYDSDHPLAVPEVGRVGVAIDSVDDLVELFDGIPLGRMSVNFTINATAPIILAFYVLAAEQQGVATSELAGTLQNDILKEFLARKAFVFPPEPSMRLVADVIEWSSQHLPRFNPISVTGYHAREAGCTATQELAFSMASAIAYSQELVGRGLDFDDFAQRLSFHFSTSLNLFEEVAKLRAARRMWHRIATERFGAKDTRSARLRFFSGNSGTTLTARQPLNNIIRSTIQCLGAVLGGAQSIHVMGYDEPFDIPTEEAVTLSLRTQQIIAHETGVAETIDPLGGSYYVEWLTAEVERRAGEVLTQIEDKGGAVAALASGMPQRWIAEEAYRRERALVAGEVLKVGVNIYEADDADVPAATRATFAVDPAVAEHQIDRIRTRRRTRGIGARDALVGLREAIAGGVNVMPALINAARQRATLGEMSDVFREAFGEFEEPSPW